MDKLTFVGRERRISKIAAMQDAMYWLQKYPVHEALNRMHSKIDQWQRELDEDTALKKPEAHDAHEYSTY